MRFEVIVENIGTVHRGTDEETATGIFHDYVEQSSKGYGRAAHEPVYLVEDGRIVDEWRPDQRYEDSEPTHCFDSNINLQMD